MVPRVTHVVSQHTLLTVRRESDIIYKNILDDNILRELDYPVRR
jgi:hypothetical protein